MTDPSPPFSRRTFAGSNTATSSPAWGAGPTLLDLLDGPPTGPSGPDPAPVSPSPWPATAEGPTTPATSGRSGSGWSLSAALQSSLENRLRVRLAGRGSPLFVLTWKHWAMPSGPLICALRASARRTSDNGSTFWPTPCVPNGGRSVSLDKLTATGQTLDGRKHTVTLEHVAKFAMATWPTPRSSDADKGIRTVEGGLRESLRTAGPDLPTISTLATWPTPTLHDAERGGQAKRAMGETRHGSNLQDFAKLAAWATPQANDYKGAPHKTYRERGGGSKSQQLSHQIRLAFGPTLSGWPTPMAGSPATTTYNEAGDTCNGRRTRLLVSGPIATGSPVATAPGGQLNPAHSRWLQGYPAAWDACAATATQSFRNSRRRSSKPTST